MRTGRTTIVPVLIIIMTLFPHIPPAPAAQTDVSFSFAFAGDTGQYGASYGTGVNNTGSFYNSAASLQALPQGLSFFVDDGDQSYNGTSNGNAPTGNEVDWCNFVKANVQSNLGTSLPWITVVGNHEDGNSPFERDGYIDAFTAPNCLPQPQNINFVPSTAGCPDAQILTGCYGREGYWDYPSANPIARFIMIAGAEKIGIGNQTTAYSYCPLGMCNNINFDKRWDWLKRTIDQAKSLGEWVILFDHKPCLSPDLGTACEGNGTFNGHNPGAQKWNLFFSEGVDLVINGHAHVHARSKQLTCWGSSEPSTTLPSTVSYTPSCVVDNGSDNTYTRGKGLVNVIEGDFSQIDGQLNFTRGDIQYFSEALSSRAYLTIPQDKCCWVNGTAIDVNSGIGFGEVTLSASQLTYNWHMSLETHYIGSKAPTFSDTFTIQAPASTQDASQNPSLWTKIIENLPVAAAIVAAAWVALILTYAWTRRPGKPERTKPSRA